MSRIGRVRLPIILTVLAAVPAAAQQTAVDLDPVDQAIEDVSVLSMSLREIEPGLRQPNDFSRVYRVQGTQGLFMRQQGGLYAVFPESVYSVNKEGQLRALVPDGTVFYIGPPPVLNPDPSPEPPPDGMVQGRINLKIKGPDPFSMQDRRRDHDRSTKRGLSPLIPLIVSDEAYRHRRLHGLMRRAAAARGKGRPICPWEHENQ